MAIKKHYVDLDLSENQLLNAVIQNLPSAPSNPKDGQIYYNTSSGKEGFYGYVNEAWVDLSDIFVHPTQSPIDTGALGGATVINQISVNEQGHVVNIKVRDLTLADLGYTGDKDANNYTHPDTGLETGSPLSGLTVFNQVLASPDGQHIYGFKTRDLTNSDIKPIFLSDVSTNLNYTWSSKKISDEIADAVAGGTTIKGGYNAGTNVPDLTTSPNPIEIGDTYVVTTGGVFFSEGVQIGDMLIATKDSPSALGDWIRVNKNIPDILDTNQTQKGIVRMATQAEVNAGLSEVLGVSPKTLKVITDGLAVNGVYKQSIGGASLTSFDLDHNLNTKDVIVQAYFTSNGETVEVGVERSTVDKVVIKINEPVASNSIRVLIKALY